MPYFLNGWIKFFVLLTPFFALSMFVLLTANRSASEKRTLALKVTAAVFVICLTLFFLGNVIFQAVGITIDSFRVGAGLLLFLSAVELVQGRPKGDASEKDIAVVPLSVPVIVGPATTGALLVTGAEITDGRQRLIALSSLVLAILSIGAILLAADLIERLFKRKGIVVLSKLTGLFLSALASQMVFEGARNLLR
jgi:multiple antibiotic resistance protein